MDIGVRQYDTAPVGPGQEAELEKIGLVHIFNGACILSRVGSDGIEANGPALKDGYHGHEHAAIHRVEAQLIDSQHVETLLRCRKIHGPGPLHLCVIPDPAQQAIGDTGRAPGAGGDLQSPLIVDLYAQDLSAANDDLLELFGRIELQLFLDAEPVPKGGTEHAQARGGADQGELGKIQADASGAGAFADDDIQGVILHGGMPNACI